MTQDIIKLMYARDCIQSKTTHRTMLRNYDWITENYEIKNTSHQCVTNAYFFLWYSYTLPK